MIRWKTTTISCENSTNFIKQIKWNISETSKAKRNETLQSDKKDTEKHIMISYNYGSRPLCIKIKDYLISLGYKVWIDVNDIYGSSLQAMAQAVENSSCVLMYVT